MSKRWVLTFDTIEPIKKSVALFFLSHILKIIAADGTFVFLFTRYHATREQYWDASRQPHHPMGDSGRIGPMGIFEFITQR